MENASRRLQAVQRALSPEAQWKRVLELPDGAKVDVTSEDDAKEPRKVAIDGEVVCLYRTLPRTLSLVISAIGTEFEQTAEHVPKFSLLELSPPSTVDASKTSAITIADLWAVLSALHTLLHTQETIPIILSPSFSNNEELAEYLLRSGLARRRHTHPLETQTVVSEPELYLLRATFWQGGGTTGWHQRGWLRDSLSLSGRSFYPSVQSFTRTSLVITSHPLRPTKPHPGKVIYRKYWPSIGQTLEFTSFDLEGNGEEVSKHLAAFNRWHNSERVNRGWGEAGPIEKHRQYIKDLLADPATIPLMMSWDGELMGYVEFVWLKENHVAQYVPEGAKDWDRGFHCLVGEDKFRGLHRSKAWMSSIHHFAFLSDPRTERVIGEPKANNPGIIKVSLETGMHIMTTFDFPYKRSAMTWNPRERFFKLDMLGE